MLKFIDHPSAHPEEQRHMCLDWLAHLLSSVMIFHLPFPILSFDEDLTCQQNQSGHSWTVTLVQNEARRQKKEPLEKEMENLYYTFLLKSGLNETTMPKDDHVIDLGSVSHAYQGCIYLIKNTTKQ